MAIAIAGSCGRNRPHLGAVVSTVAGRETTLKLKLIIYSARACGSPVGTPSKSLVSTAGPLRARGVYTDPNHAKVMHFILDLSNLIYYECAWLVIF